MNAEIVEGLKLVRDNRTLLALAWLAGLWQLLHHMQLAVLILFATRELGLSAGAIGLAYIFGGLGCMLAAASAEKLSARLGVGPVIVHGLLATAIAWQAFGLIAGPVWFATVALGLAMLLFDFGGVLFGINYLALRQAITPDRLLGRMTATMRFLTVAAAPLGSLAGGALATVIGLRGDADHRRRAGPAARGGRDRVVAGAPAPTAADGRRRLAALERVDRRQPQQRESSSSARRDSSRAPGRRGRRAPGGRGSGGRPTREFRRQRVVEEHAGVHRRALGVGQLHAQAQARRPAAVAHALAQVEGEHLAIGPPPATRGPRGTAPRAVAPARPPARPAAAPVRPRAAAGC